MGGGLQEHWTDDEQAGSSAGSKREEVPQDLICPAAADTEQLRLSRDKELNMWVGEGAQEDRCQSCTATREGPHGGTRRSMTLVQARLKNRCGMWNVT